MKRPRIRATFLLRCVALAACAALFVTVVYLTRSLTVTAATLIVFIVAWFIGIEAGLLPAWIEHRLTERAARSGKPFDSIWFIDLDAQEDRVREEFHDATRDNPTLR